jgi:hypothetical protein
MILAELNALDAVDHDHHHGALHCTWQETLFDLTCSKLEYGDPLLTILQKLGTARLICEELEDLCLGILVQDEHHHDYAISYRVITNYTDDIMCSATAGASPKIQKVWLKNCSLVELYDGDDQLHDSRTKRSDTDSDATLMTSALLFKSPDFEGSGMNISGAVDYVGDDWKDSIASISCDQCVVIVFEHPGFVGRQLAMENGVRSMDPFFRDNLASVMVLPTEALSELCFTVYTEVYNSGENATFCGDQNLSETPWNRRVASIEILCPDECNIIVFDHEFTGRFKAFNSFTFAEDLDDVGKDWYNSIVSIQIRPWTYEEGYEGQFEPVAIFYENPQRNGATQSAIGEIEVFAARMNDTVSSFECDQDCSVITFTGQNFTGDSHLYRHTKSILTNPVEDRPFQSAIIMDTVVCVARCLVG